MNWWRQIPTISIPSRQPRLPPSRKDLALDSFSVQLLHGVTGSGKTEVYLRAIDNALKTGGGVVFLVPEVALTPQTVARLRSRLEAIAPGHRCVVWHSHLSEGERLDGWLALANGEARIVVGARSAVFAPVLNLKLIVVDEEHEPAYKQDESPRYHGRDVAVMRAKIADCLCLLGSATPSLESYSNALAGRYTLLQLLQRVDDRKLPHIDVVDMRIEITRQRGLATLSRRLVDEMHARFAKKEQTILFINRRGYSVVHAVPQLRQGRRMPPLQCCDDLPQNGRNPAVSLVRRGTPSTGALHRVRGSGHPVEGSGYPEGGGGGEARSSSGQDRAYGRGHDE